MAQKQKAIINQKTIVLAVIAVVAGVLLTTGTYLARGWIRGPLAAWYVKSVYLPKIEKSFERDFKDVDPKLAPLGFTFDQHYSAYLDKPAFCNDAFYEGFGLTIGCYKIYYNDNPGPEITSAYREQWSKQSPALESYLLADGWKKIWNEDQPINELLTRDDRGVSVGVNYEKYHGKITCKLSIWYNGPPSAPGERTFNTEQSCNREVGFFGGGYY